MARRTGRQAEESTTPEATAEGSAPTEEAPVTETPTTEAPTEAAASTTEDTDLTEFTAAVEAAVAEADTSTGEVPEASLTAVTAQYRALEGIKAKNDAKKLVNERMKDAMNSGNLPVARANLNISEKALVAAAGGGGKSSTPADPTENFVQRVATLTLAYQQAVATVPEGVGDDWQAKVEALVSESQTAVGEYRTWSDGDPESRGDEPEVSAVIRNAVKLASGKAAKAGVSRGGGTFTGERRDIGVHIENAFADKEEGTFLTIAEIRNTRSDEYGDTPPSAGAISARLFPKSGKSTMTKVGVKPDTQDGKKGAVKVPVEES